MTDFEAVINKSHTGAGDAMKSLFDQPDRRMSGDEFRAFVGSVRLWAMATAGKDGSPHIAPVHLRLTDEDQLQMTIQTESVRMRDVQRDPRVAFTGWAKGGKTAIIYGTASLIPDTERVSTAGGRSKPVASLRITPTRIYAMDPRRE